MTDITSSENSSKREFEGNIFLVGFMGSGKTHWGEIWSTINEWSFVDLDEVIESKEGKSITEIFESQGEDHFRQSEARVLRACISLKRTIVACGGGTPCFYDNMQWMNEHGITIYLSCSPGQIYERVSKEQEQRPLIKKLIPAELLLFIEQKLNERLPFYSMATYTIPAHLLTPEYLKEIILPVT